MILFCVSATGDDGSISLPVQVEATVDKTSVFIGDRIKYTIEVTADKEVELQLPEFGDNLAEFAIRDFGSSKGGFWGARTLTQWYLLDIYETGEFSIPGAMVKYRVEGDDEWKGLNTDEISVEVISVLDKNDKEPEIRDIKGPVRYRNWSYFFIILSAIPVIILLLLLIRYLVNRKKTRVTSTPSFPAHEIAIKALNKLMRENYLKTGQTQQHYFELSNIVRHYLENRFQLKAPEMTTEEFLTILRKSEVLDPDQKNLLKDFLSHSDMVKFAKHIPEDIENDSSYNFAKKLIDQTKEVTVEGDI